MQLTVSELIKQLQKLEGAHGDAGVVSLSYTGGGVYDYVIIECLEVAEDGDVVLKERN